MSLRARVLLLLLAVPGEAGAAPTAQIGVAAASGYTNNALSATDTAATRPQDDLFFQLEPTLRLWNETPRSVQLLGAGVALSRYLNQSQANSVVGRGELALSYDVAPTMSWSGSLIAAYEDVGAITPDEVAGAVPAGGARHVTGQARTALSRDFSGTWRGVADVGLATNLPVGDSATTTRSLSSTLSLAAQTSRKRDAYEAALAGGLNAYEGGRRDVNLSLLGGWLHELSSFWGVIVRGGATLNVPDQGGAVVEPVARVRLEHVRRETAVSFELSNSVRANTLLGQTFDVAEAVVSIHGRLGPFDLDASGGASHSTALGDPGPGAAETADTVRFGASLGWSPREGFRLALRQDFVYQVTERAMMDESETLLRNSVMLAVTTTFPDAQPRVSPHAMELRVRQSEERDRAEAGRR